MSEPFANGDKDEQMISHEQNDFKRKFVYQFKDEKAEDGEIKEITTPVKETTGKAYEEALALEDLKKEKDEILKRMSERNKGQMPDVNSFTIRYWEENRFLTNL